MKTSLKGFSGVGLYYLCGPGHPGLVNIYVYTDLYMDRQVCIYMHICLCIYGASLVAQWLKDPPAVQELQKMRV